MLRFAISSDRVFEFTYFVSKHEALRSHHAFYSFAQLIPQRDILRLKIEQRNVHRRWRMKAVHRLHRSTCAICGYGDESGGLTRGSSLAAVRFGGVIIRVVTRIVVVLRLEPHIVQ